MGTAIAVLLHEIPHEMADFLIYYQKTGSFLHSMLFNIISSLCCFAGLWIGFAANQLDGANAYLLMAAAGSFIYIVVWHILPELGLERAGSDVRFWLLMVLFVFGSLLGWTAMFLLAWYEEDLALIFE